MRYGIIVFEVISVKFERIKSLREDHDLLQKDVAKILSVAQRTYSGYEIGTRTISIRSLMILAEYYNTSIDYIVGRTNQIAPYSKQK